MERSNVHKAKGPKETLQELLEKKPPIYKVAVKYTFACHSDIRFSSLFDLLFSVEGWWVGSNPPLGLVISYILHSFLSLFLYCSYLVISF
jgi:hypothetical protein